ncbi:acyl carrier protein [Streptomyces europaeiscabiei]|uniref:Acyl carrier protein n=1 Tax=Streptomyces europaeiscabiei TaxID=146819 RepID=A0ABU4NZ13_9ACTN|nr:acyl carrier protein [Streptomyces europaeiscabiei]MDX2531388.1 acyl carrier protein [Streptomyces europaeiscabiei]MDX2764873.1 acyl carrier protein [Streptomyces europaeiscabiei]MDX2774443.1 acyl carrier protein [Streptomyces europaeiscabiei]MDX3549987.1 acyl carrier protein [Streptomyces europaeiscabiei]MDX3559213.1 acyl carrier protein [Streptomyces europaeiscabiei]
MFNNPNPAQSAPGGDVPRVLDALREMLGAILRCDPWEIDEKATFHVLGLDSILGAEFVDAINTRYGLKEEAFTLYDHPTPAAMATHVVARTSARTPAAPGPARAAGPRAGLDTLLDAVRDDRLSVDEAVALLAADRA